MSWPDIDSDFPGKQRGQIKTYIEKRFGETQVASVGTYTTMKLKGLVKDFARLAGMDFSEANLITSIVDNDDLTFLDLIMRSTLEPKLKSFIKSNSDFIYMLPTLLNQPKVKSIHPCATIVFPDVMQSNEWVPCRSQNGMMVTEWSGGELDDSGFLKEDILGIKQLDKYQSILNLIKLNGKEVPDIYNLPDDREAYRYFGNGWNCDVFQFGAAGLSDYSKKLKPQNMADLIAAIALYRPGPMENHYHEIYAKCKNEGREVEYLWGTEEITKETYGILCYQEQVMQVFQQLGGLTMKEADDVRRALGKKNLKYILGYKEQVRAGFLERGSTEENFEITWAATEEFAKYSFNKSHSAAYALTGYVSQYLKVNYPIEFWTVALEYASETETLNFLSEIMQAKTIGISPPDINKSEITMTSDQETSNIFWGIDSIKGIGEDTAAQIINERKKNGPYLSFADFFFRSAFTGSKVKKQTYEALITSGCFDILYNFKGDEKKRYSLIRRFRIFKKVKVGNPKTDIYTIGTLNENWWWQLNQKLLTGLSQIDYKAIAETNFMDAPFCTPHEFTTRQDRDIVRTFGGYVVECRIGRSTKGNYARLTLEHNYKQFKLMVWTEEYNKIKDQLKGCEKALVVFDGAIRYDEKYSKSNQFTLKKDSDFLLLK